MTTKMRRFAAAVVIALVCGGITWLAMAESGDYATMGYDTPNGYSFWRVNSSGYLVPGADNTLDIGTAALSPRNLYCDGTATIATLSMTGNLSVAAGGSLTATLLTKTTTQMATYTPIAAGVLIYESTNMRVCVSTGTGAGAVVTSSSAVTACYP